MRLARHVARMVDRTGAYRDMVGRPEGMRPFARSRHRWDDNIKVDLMKDGGASTGFICQNSLD